MLKFLPRLVRRVTGGVAFIQQVCVGQRSDDIVCDYCYYKSDWSSTFTKQDCERKHHCQAYTQPFIFVGPLHYNEIQTQMVPGSTVRKLYQWTQVTRQVKVKGWPLYLQLFGCDNPQPQCNAMCYYHNERLKNKQTVARCAHQHGCSRSGSFWDLLIPENLDLQQQFFNELNEMNP